MRALWPVAFVAACGDNATPLCPIEAPRAATPAPFEDVKFVAHAFGSPLGLLQLEHYTESREAFEASYHNGFRAYEIDLLVLGDGTVVAAHDKDEAKYGLDGRFVDFTRADLEGRKWNGKYDVLFAEDVVAIAAAHPDIWLILDTKCCHEQIARKFIELAPDDTVRDRFVPHVTSAAHAAALPGIYPFPEKMYARYWWDGTDDDVLARMQTYGIDNTMMWWDSRWNETLQATMEGAGYHVWVHTPADPDRIEDFVARDVGVYTDGYITCPE
jgi:hypothetical protein